MSSDLGGALGRGAFWSIVLRWGTRLIGLLSTLVLARLLTPSDYGLVAMAALVMGLVETFLDADATTALLRSRTMDPDFQHSAWTLRLLQALVVASVGAICAPFAALYFEEPRITLLLFAYCVITVTSGFTSVGPLIARRQLDFFLEVKIGLFARFVGFVASLGLALVLRSYWALAFGAFVGALTSVVAGYVLHPYRPRIRFNHVRELFGYSQWLLVSGIGLFLARKLDGFVVGRKGSAADLGAYNVSLELGQMITMELGAPLNRSLLPVLANMHDDRPRMHFALMKTVAAVNTVTLPAGIGRACGAPDAVRALLGPQWSAAIPLLSIFASIGAIRFMTGPYYTLLMTLGMSRLMAIMSWIELGVFALAITFFWSYGIIGIAMARVVSALTMGGAWLFLGTRHGLELAAFVRAVYRPCLGTALMALTLWVLPPLGLTHLFELGYRVLVGAIVYLVFITLSWIAAGRPAGLEQMVVGKLGRLLDRRVHGDR